MEVLQAKNLKKIYGSGNNAVHALDGVDLSVKKGEFVAIVGTSGSGKSTLLHMLGGLDRPTSGTVMVDGQDIFSLKEEALTIFHDCAVCRAIQPTQHVQQGRLAGAGCADNCNKFALLHN